MKVKTYKMKYPNWKKKLDELEGLMIKKEDLVNSQRNMEDRMERNIDKL